jgi:uncharacterized membrane protein YeaQ/YmgE (transglycosylase-associated protein family)
MDAGALIIWIVIGLVAGWVARLLLGGKGGLIRYLVSGLLGSVVGGFIVSYFGIQIPIEHDLLRQIVVAAGGAVIVVAIARAIA